jgi:hypothetical protein
MIWEDWHRRQKYTGACPAMQGREVDIVAQRTSDKGLWRQLIIEGKQVQSVILCLSCDNVPVLTP